MSMSKRYQSHLKGREWESISVRRMNTKALVQACPGSEGSMAGAQWMRRKWGQKGRNEQRLYPTRISGYESELGF